MPVTIDASQVEKLAARGLPADAIADFLGLPRDAFKAGMTDEMLGELLAVVGMANETNRLANGYRVQVDERFKS